MSLKHEREAKDDMGSANDFITMYPSLTCPDSTIKKSNVQYGTCLTLKATATSLPTPFYAEHQSCKALPMLA